MTRDRTQRVTTTTPRASSARRPDEISATEAVEETSQCRRELERQMASGALPYRTVPWGRGVMRLIRRSDLERLDSAAGCGPATVVIAGMPCVLRRQVLENWEGAFLV